ncbi:hypothetical protein SAMN05444002_2441 [Vannielia litorea]|uniref:Uncharacterized protein n=1 Tax=Vannielia litorea TaxID=1217970 RepID=A0A1N6GFN7_9RHOB|nr:hypothetical protein SAMN05444002_2441 [Vannielia litorea]
MIQFVFDLFVVPHPTPVPVRPVANCPTQGDRT